MTKIFWCTKCVVASTRPRVTFDKNGVCTACQWAEKKKTLDWSHRQKLLDKLLSDQDKSKPFQCITAVSGGKDGSYISYMLKNKKKNKSISSYNKTPNRTKYWKKKSN